MIKRDVLIKPYTYYKIGGTAKYFAEVTSVSELKQVLGEWKKICKTEGADVDNIFILGGGSNILFSDSGFSGLVIFNKLDYIKQSRGGTELTVGAGTSISKVAREAAKFSLTGFEWASGLPGTVGGAVVGNSGCFGSEIKDVVKKLKVLDLESWSVFSCSNSDCEFEYRGSTFKKEKGSFVLEATFGLKKGDEAQIKARSAEVLNARREKQPLEYPSCGSVFKNVSYMDFPDDLRELFKDFVKTEPFPVIPAGLLIEKAGLKGKRVGGAMISEKHANFIVNTGNASAEDVLGAIEHAKAVVNQKFGVTLVPEIELVG